jgi:hypothetical protein
MDKEKFGKMTEIMKSCRADKVSISRCCSIMKKMMQHGDGKEAAEKQEKDTRKT